MGNECIRNGIVLPSKGMQIDGRGTGRVPKEGDSIRISTKGFDVVSNPLESDTLVENSKVLFRQSRGVGEPKKVCTITGQGGPMLVKEWTGNEQRTEKTYFTVTITASLLLANIVPSYNFVSVKPHINAPPYKKTNTGAFLLPGFVQTFKDKQSSP